MHAIKSDEPERLTSRLGIGTLLAIYFAIGAVIVLLVSRLSL